MKLYEFALSGHSHKVRLLLSLLQLPCENIAVDGGAGEHKSEAFLALNPFGQVPVLRDGETVIRDSQAILVYLAHRHGGPRWWPQDSAELAGAMAWLAVAGNEVARGPNALRLHHKFGRSIDLDSAAKVTQELLQVLERTLAARPWLNGDRLSIADIAVYPYISLSPEGGVELSSWPNVCAWLGRIRSLPDYLDMPGTWHPT